MKFFSATLPVAFVLLCTQTFVLGQGIKGRSFQTSQPSPAAYSRQQYQKAVKDERHQSYSEQSGYPESDHFGRRLQAPAAPSPDQYMTYRSDPMEIKPRPVMIPRGQSIGPDYIPTHEPSKVYSGPMEYRQQVPSGQNVFYSTPKEDQSAPKDTQGKPADQTQADWYRYLQKYTVPSHQLVAKDQGPHGPMIPFSGPVPGTLYHIKQFMLQPGVGTPVLYYPAPVQQIRHYSAPRPYNVPFSPMVQYGGQGPMMYHSGHGPVQKIVQMSRPDGTSSPVMYHTGPGPVQNIEHHQIPKQDGVDRPVIYHPGPGPVQKIDHHQISKQDGASRPVMYYTGPGPVQKIEHHQMPKPEGGAQMYHPGSIQRMDYSQISVSNVNATPSAHHYGPGSIQRADQMPRPDADGRIQNVEQSQKPETVMYHTSPGPKNQVDYQIPKPDTVDTPLGHKPDQGSVQRNEHSQMPHMMGTPIVHQTGPVKQIHQFHPIAKPYFNAAGQIIHPGHIGSYQGFDIPAPYTGAPLVHPRPTNYQVSRADPVVTQTKYHTPVFVTSGKESSNYKYSVSNPVRVVMPTQYRQVPINGPQGPVQWVKMPVPQSRLDGQPANQYYRLPVDTIRNEPVRSFFVPPYMHPYPIGSTEFGQTPPTRTVYKPMYYGIDGMNDQQEQPQTYDSQGKPLTTVTIEEVPRHDDKHDDKHKPSTASSESHYKNQPQPQAMSVQPNGQSKPETVNVIAGQPLVGKPFGMPVDQTYSPGHRYDSRVEYDEESSEREPGEQSNSFNPQNAWVSQSQEPIGQSYLSDDDGTRGVTLNAQQSKKK